MTAPFSLLNPVSNIDGVMAGGAGIDQDGEGDIGKINSKRAAKAVAQELLLDDDESPKKRKSYRPLPSPSKNDLHAVLYRANYPAEHLRRHKQLQLADEADLYSDEIHSPGNMGRGQKQEGTPSPFADSGVSQLDETNLTVGHIGSD